MTATRLQELEKILKDAEYYRQKLGVKKKDPEELDKIFHQIEKTLEKMAESSGLTVDELVDALDPSQPFPF
jgi:tetrahydromethanopterin S-methyltransferase subunit B